MVRRDGSGLSAGRMLIVVAGMIAAGVVLFWLTQPWPTRGPGGGRGANLWGPIVTIAGMPAIGWLLFRLLRRRSG